MKTYKIGVVWQMYGSVEVEANSLEEAVKQVDNGGGDMPLPDNGEYYFEGSFKLPDNGEYIEGSFEVDVTSI